MLTIGSLFSGIGAAELAAKKLGWKIVWQCENDKYCLKLLNEKCPDAFKVGDITSQEERQKLIPVDLIVGGDPCPIRSIAKGNRKSRHPDLAGYFLAVVGNLWPEWLVRENVFAPDVKEFVASLELLGYGVAVIGLDSRDFTAQSRRRQFVVGSLEFARQDIEKAFLNAADGYGFDSPINQEDATFASCLTAHPHRFAAEDSYCFEPGRGLRILLPQEREALQGFPRGWTAGFSPSRRAMMTGNAMTVPVVIWIFKVIREMIKEFELNHQTNK